MRGWPQPPLEHLLLNALRQFLEKDTTVKQETQVQQCIAYGLITDVDDNIRYVGQTTQDISARVQQHIKCANKETTYKANWLNNRLSRGLDIKVVLLDEDAVWDVTETAWIKRLREGGCKLTNATDGGEGTIGYKYTKEHLWNVSNKYELKDGRVMTIQELSEITTVSRGTLSYRLLNGYTPDEAISTRKKNEVLITYNGKDYTINEAADEFDMTASVLYKRYNDGWSHTKIIDKPICRALQHLTPTGEYLTAKQIADRVGVTKACIITRIQKGCTPQELVLPNRNINGR